MAIDDKEWGKLTQKIKDMHDDIKEIKSDVKAQNTRVDKLEVRWGYMVGVGSVLVIVIPLLIKFLI